MAGLYLHIPFCKQACHYCDFHFSTVLHSRDQMVQMIARELVLRAPKVTESIETIYYGGGTPSLLTHKHLALLVETIHHHYRVRSRETTIEVNPDDVTHDNIRMWKDVGISRVSVGVQSFFSDELAYMNRSHDGQTAVYVLEMLRDSGMDMSVDLIIGLPQSSRRRTKENIDRLLAYEPAHISCYLLTVEPKTPLYTFIRRRQCPPPNEQIQKDVFLYASRLLSSRGYCHYELSNFCVPGKQAVHNTLYWKGKNYLGVGPSAHSLWQGQRFWNVANNPLYIRALEQGILPETVETLTLREQYNEYVLCGLRLQEGVELAELSRRFSGFQTYFCQKVRGLPAHWYCLENGVFSLTEQGRLFCDTIAVQLFADE